MGRYTSDEETALDGPCPYCTTHDPHLRSRHHLTLARSYPSLDAVRVHLVSHDTRGAQADDCIRWLAQVIEQYTGIPDPETGAPLPWWEARRQLALARDQIAKHCYAEAPEAYRRYIEGLPPAEVPGFAHLQAEEGTPFPEEAPYVPTPSQARWYDDPEAWEEREPGWNDGP